MEEGDGELRDIKRPRRPWKTNVVDDRRIFFPGEEKTPSQQFTISSRTSRGQKALSVSKTTIKRRPHQVSVYH